MFSSDSTWDSTWLQHAQILDSALPIGAFSHSFGLESLVYEGHVSSVQSLEHFLKSTLHGAWSTSDALLVKGAYILEQPELWSLDKLMDASRVSRETREGMRKMGRQALKLATAIHPYLNLASLESALREGQCPGSWPLVYGTWTRALGVPLNRAAIGYLYGCCSAALGNAVRLSLIGQTSAQGLLAHLLPEMETSWRAVEDRDPFDFSTSLPVLEIAQLRHQWQDARLFMS